MLLHSFKVDFSGIGGSTETGLMSHCILSDTFSIVKLRGVGKSKHHHKHKTHGGQRQKSRVTTNLKKKKKQNPRKQQSPLHYTWAGLESKRSQDSGAAVPRRLLAPIFLMREPSRLDIVGSGSSFQPMLFSPQRNEPSYSLIPFWHPWPKCLQSHRPTATAIHFLSTTYPFAFC